MKWIYIIAISIPAMIGITDLATPTPTPPYKIPDGNGMFTAGNDGATAAVNDIQIASGGLTFQGVSNPDFVIEDQTDPTQFIFRHASSTATWAGQFNARRSRGSLASPSNTNAGDRCFQINAQAYQNGAENRNIVGIVAETGSSFGSSNYHGKLRLGVTADGATNWADRIVIDGDVVQIEDANDTQFVLPNFTTTERNALTAVTGSIIWNTTTGKVEVYDGSSWASVPH